MQFKLITAIIVLLLLVASLSVSGCAFSTTSPTASPTPVPDYSATLAKISKSGGWTAINSISKVNDTLYAGAYKSGNKNQTYELTIELANSEAAAKERYGQLVLLKKSDGFTTYSNTTALSTGDSTIYGTANAVWNGYKLFSTSVSSSIFTVLYTHNTEIDKWIVVTMSGETISQSM